MTPYCPYCSAPTVCLQEPNNLPVGHLLSASAYRWVCHFCHIDMAYVNGALYLMFLLFAIGPYKYSVQLRSHLPPALWVYKTETMEDIPIPEALANQLTPQNIESKIRTFLTFS